MYINLNFSYFLETYIIPELCLSRTQSLFSYNPTFIRKDFQEDLDFQDQTLKSFLLALTGTEVSY
jgi:hypothetical protein